GAVRRGEEPGHGHADLHGREELVGVPHQLRGALTARPALLQLLDLRFAEVHDRHLGAREHAADEHEQEHEGDVHEDGRIHGHTLPVPGGATRELTSSHQGTDVYVTSTAGRRSPHAYVREVVAVRSGKGQWWWSEQRASGGGPSQQGQQLLPHGAEDL